MNKIKLYKEDDLIPISALQHFVFCERQWALIHLEQIWAENQLTVEGHLFHEQVDYGNSQKSKKGLKICRRLRLRSLLYGVTGIADVVEFHTDPKSGKLQPYPIEYKRGNPKQNSSDIIQLCAQALCLEEMMETKISHGALFYGEPRRRTVIAFDENLRKKTIECIEKIHLLSKQKKTPLAHYTKKCDKCSLFHICMPHQMDDSLRAEQYLNKIQKWVSEDSE